MNYDRYEQDLYGVYESEVLGEVLFGLLARWTRNPARKRKWDALARLETQTKQRYLEHVADKPALNQRAEPGKLKAYAYALIFVLVPWKMAMKMLSDGTAPFMEVFARLASHSSDEEREFFNYVVAHEDAIKAFADAELAGDEARSLTAVEMLVRLS